MIPAQAPLLAACCCVRVGVESAQLAHGHDLPALTQSGHRNDEKRVLHREVRHTIRGAKLVDLAKVFKRALAKGSIP